MLMKECTTSAELGGHAVHVPVARLTVMLRLCSSVTCAPPRPSLQLSCRRPRLVWILWSRDSSSSLHLRCQLPWNTEVAWGLRGVRPGRLSNMHGSDLGAVDGGQGVHVYLLDASIRRIHQDFEDRAIPTPQTAWLSFRCRREVVDQCILQVLQESVTFLRGWVSVGREGAAGV